MFTNTFTLPLLLSFPFWKTAPFFLFRLHCFESLPSSYSIPIIIVLFVYVTFKRECTELKTKPQVWSEESELRFIITIFVPDIILLFMLLNSRLAVLFQLPHAADSHSIYCNYNKASRSFLHMQLWIHIFNILFLCFAFMSFLHVELPLLDWEGWIDKPRLFKSVFIIQWIPSPSQLQFHR